MFKVWTDPLRWCLGANWWFVKCYSSSALTIVSMMMILFVFPTFIFGLTYWYTLIHKKYTNSFKLQNCKSQLKKNLFQIVSFESYFCDTADELSCIIACRASQCTMRTLEVGWNRIQKIIVMYPEAPMHLRHLPTRLLGIMYKCVFTIQRHFKHKIKIFEFETHRN